MMLTLTVARSLLLTKSYCSLSASSMLLSKIEESSEVSAGTSLTPSPMKIMVYARNSSRFSLMTLKKFPIRCSISWSLRLTMEVVSLITLMEDLSSASLVAISSLKSWLMISTSLTPRTTEVFLLEVKTITLSTSSNFLLTLSLKLLVCTKTPKSPLIPRLLTICLPPSCLSNQELVVELVWLVTNVLPLLLPIFSPRLLKPTTLMKLERHSPLITTVASTLCSLRS